MMAQSKMTMNTTKNPLEQEMLPKQVVPAPAAEPQLPMQNPVEIPKKSILQKPPLTKRPNRTLNPKDGKEVVPRKLIRLRKRGFAQFYGQ
jgi:hypothetical protein